MNKELIKHLRSIAGNLSQRDLAEKVGCDQSLISRIESGVTPLQPQMQFKILQVFSDNGISTQDVILLQGIFQSRKYKQVKKEK